MPFVSTLPPGCVIVDESNYREHAAQACAMSDGVGYHPRDYAAEPFGSVAEPFNLPLIPRSEWRERIEELERTKSRLSDIVKRKKVPPKNQGRTNYCWGNGVVTGVEAIRAAANLPYVELSPASICAPIKGYRNVGGWSGEALAYIVKHGICSADAWPVNAIDRQYDNAASQANRALHKVTEWYELQARSFEAKATLLLNRIPVPGGYGWMGHLMCGFDLVVLPDGSIGCVDRNSWGQNQEWYALRENRGTPDDAVAPRVFMAGVK